MKCLIFDHNKGIWRKIWRNIILVNKYPSLRQDEASLLDEPHIPSILKVDYCHISSGKILPHWTISTAILWTKWDGFCQGTISTASWPLVYHFGGNAAWMRIISAVWSACRPSPQLRTWLQALFYEPTIDVDTFDDRFLVFFLSRKRALNLELSKGAQMMALTSNNFRVQLQAIQLRPIFAACGEAHKLEKSPDRVPQAFLYLYASWCPFSSSRWHFSSSIKE